MSEYVVLNAETGEIINNAKVSIVEANTDSNEKDELMYDKEYYQKLVKLQSKYEYLKKREQQSSKKEQFVQCIYDPENCFNDLSPQSLCRLMLVATYSSYTTRGNNHTQQGITRLCIKKILKLNERTVDLFIKEMVEKNYFIKQNGRYTVNDKYFIRGKCKLNRKQKKDRRFIRIYINAYRSLYNSLSPNDHIYLGYTLKLLPYLNMQWNVLSLQPLEKDRECISLLNMKEVCQILKFSGEQSTRFFNKLYNITFPVEDWQETLYYRDKESRAIYINPRIMYAGDDIEPDIQNNFLTTERSNAYGTE